MAEISTYDWTITVKKFFIQMILVGAIASLVWAVEEGIPELVLSYPQYATILAMLSAVVTAILNYLKHYKDSIEVDDDYDMPIS